MRFSWASRSNFCVFQSALVTRRGMREVRTYTQTHISCDSNRSNKGPFRTVEISVNKK